jgi:prepilin-type N-terminal cleavage/methylation domain-containing protein
LRRTYGLRPTAYSLRRYRSAVTLVELLITMVIVAIIAAAILGTASAALDAARRSRTQSIILKLHNLLMERWGDYETRRVDILPLHIANLDDMLQKKVQSNNLTYGQAALVRGQIMADLRLLGLRELMKIEMPDRWSDIALASVGQSPGTTQILADRTPLALRYLRQYSRFDAAADEDAIRSNQGAECLYMIIMYATGDGEAREQFTDQDIGDTDGDGAPEFLDGWGRPIGFIRWPAGFASPVQPLNPDPSTGNLVRDPMNDHDPFDPFRRDSPDALPLQQQDYDNFWSLVAHLKDPTRAVDAGFALVPLIYSMGPDEDADFTVFPDVVVGLDPYMSYDNPDGDPRQLGATFDQEQDGDGWNDNIHNHLSEY